jgi:hypothetical protein
MPRYVLRVWLPDRPGALGLVASRIGAARGDVIGIEILEQGGGRAVDELVVELPDPGSVDLLVREVSEVDGVDVEWVQALGDEDHDPQLALLEAAARLVEAGDEPARLSALCADVRTVFEADWTAVVDVARQTTLAGAGEVPAASWVAAFVDGSRHLAQAHGLGAEDVAWAERHGHDQVVAVGRSGRPFRARERRQLDVLARISAPLGQERSVVAQPRDRSTPRRHVS